MKKIEKKFRIDPLEGPEFPKFRSEKNGSAEFDGRPTMMSVGLSECETTKNDFVYYVRGKSYTRACERALLNSREAAMKITAGIARGHVRGQCRLELQVVAENRLKMTSPNTSKGHDGYFH